MRHSHPWIAILVLVGVLAAGSGDAAVSWTVSASSPDGDLASGLGIGDRLVLDIGATTTIPEAFVIVGVVAPYDRSVLVPNLAESRVPDSLFNSICLPPTGPCFGGSAGDNQGSFPADAPYETELPNGLFSLTIFQSLAITAAAGDGTQDVPFPQFQIVFDVVGAGVSDLRIGSIPEYGGAYGTFTGDDSSSDASLTIVTPEPGAALLLAWGLIGLAIRRRPPGA